MRQTVYDELRDTLSKILAVAPAELCWESGPHNVSNWDSVRHLDLVLTLEQQYGLTLSPEDIERMLLGVEPTVEVICSKLAARPESRDAKRAVDRLADES